MILVFFLRCISVTIGKTPRRLIDSLAGSLAFLVPFLAKKEYRQAQVNVFKIYELAPRTEFSRQFIRQCSLHFFRSCIDLLGEIYGGKKIEIVNLNAYQDFVKENLRLGRGLIIVSGHIGNWELIAKYSKLAMSRDLFVLAKPSRSKVVTHFLADFRNRLGCSVLWNDSKFILREMLTALKNRDALGFVMDQKPANRQGERLDFLGFPAEFVSGPAQIAQRSNCPIIAVFCIHIAPLKYRFYYESISQNPTQISERELTRIMVRSIEEIIKIFPEQWTWNYKRWKFNEN